MFTGILNYNRKLEKHWFNVLLSFFIMPNPVVLVHRSWNELQDKVGKLFWWQRIWRCKYEYNKDWPENLFAYRGFKSWVNYIIC